MHIINKKATPGSSRMQGVVGTDPRDRIFEVFLVPYAGKGAGIIVCRYLVSI